MDEFKPLTMGTPRESMTSERQSTPGDADVLTVVRPPGRAAMTYRSDAAAFNTVKVPEKVRPTPHSSCPPETAPDNPDIVRGCIGKVVETPGSAPPPSRRLRAYLACTWQDERSIDSLVTLDPALATHTSSCSPESTPDNS